MLNQYRREQGYESLRRVECSDNSPRRTSETSRKCGGNRLQQKRKRCGKPRVVWIAALRPFLMESVVFYAAVARMFARQNV